MANMINGLSGGLGTASTMGNSMLTGADGNLQSDMTQRDMSGAMSKTTSQSNTNTRTGMEDANSMAQNTIDQQQNTAQLQSAVAQSTMLSTLAKSLADDISKLG